jgi:hypothetical protein
MKPQLLVACVAIVALSTGHAAQADTASFNFGAAGIILSGELTYDSGGDATGAHVITGISGTFSDSNSIPALVNETITGLEAIDPVVPYPGTPFPTSFSSHVITNPNAHGAGISYDNLFYPNGSPIVCPDYPGAGGFLDVYGVMFTLGNGYIVDLWSNGVLPGASGPIYYGVAVIDPNNKLVDYQAAIPEPSSLCLVTLGLLGAIGWRRRTARPIAR